ncbi:hypothetical protein QSV34_11825 [Porticoccus sp. W117]|nr:hypothetical protein [Porticoccus sp. W117]
MGFSQIHSKPSFRVYTASLLFAALLSGCNESANQAQDDPIAPPETNDVGAQDTDFNSSTFNNHDISRTQYQVDPGFISEGKLNIGDGVDMSDPGAPLRRVGQQPLKLATQLKSVPTEDYTLTENFRLQETSSVRDEANILSAYFQGSYNFASADVAYEQARQERQSSHSIYAVIDAKGIVHDIVESAPNGEVKWNTNVVPRFENGGADNAEFRQQFLADYGSHYISAITYGYRIAVRGKITETDSSKSSRIKAAFKAAFVSGSAEGGISNDNRQILTNSNVELMFAARSGGLYVDGERRPGVLTNLDDILTMLKDMREGKIKIHSAPIAATARSYWSHLPLEYKRSRALLRDYGTPPLPESVYGVPRGTVIAWQPRETYLKEDNDGNTYLQPPLGWAICNGEDGTPDLRNRFIRGTNLFDSVGKSGGQSSHTHTANSAKTSSTVDIKSGAFGAKNAATGSHKHDITVENSTNLPPFLSLVYIVKL